MRVLIQPQQPFNPLDTDLTGAEFIYQYNQYINQQVSQDLSVPLTEALGWPDWMGWVATFQPTAFHFLVGGAIFFLAGFFMVKYYPKLVEAIKKDDRAAAWVFAVALALLFGLGVFGL